MNKCYLHLLVITLLSNKKTERVSAETQGTQTFATVWTERLVYRVGFLFSTKRTMLYVITGARQRKMAEHSLLAYVHEGQLTT